LDCGGSTARSFGFRFDGAIDRNKKGKRKRRRAAAPQRTKEGGAWPLTTRAKDRERGLPSPSSEKTVMFKKILLALVVIIAVLAIVIALQPEDFKVTRSAKMAAPPAVVFEQVNDFHNWLAWNPWDKMDNDMKRSFEGPTSGVDATYKWVGNSKVGEGSMKITESRPHDSIRIRLDFLKPMEGTSDVAFTFKPEGEQTVVTWSMAGKNNFVGKAVTLLVGMETMIGTKYEEGLAEMKKIVEQKKFDAIVPKADLKVDPKVESKVDPKDKS
jgi:hypothetical protein